MSASLPGLEAAGAALKEVLFSDGAVLVFAGAGLSQESGVATFRGAGGAYEDSFRGVDVTKLPTVTMLHRDGDLQAAWYQARRDQLTAVRPSLAHESIERLSRFVETHVATQNVDDLVERVFEAQRLPLPPVHHLHGHLRHVTCTACDVVVDDLGFRLDEVRTCPACGAGATRPGVVLFGESLPIEAFRASMEAAASVQLVLLVGTSGVVQPAASIPVVAKQSGAVLVEVNPEPTALSSLCDHHLRGPAGSVLDALLDAAEFP